MLKYNKFALSKEKCAECGKTTKEIKEDFLFCSNVINLYAIHV